MINKGINECKIYLNFIFFPQKPCVKSYKDIRFILRKYAVLAEERMRGYEDEADPPHSVLLTVKC